MLGIDDVSRDVLGDLGEAEVEVDMEAMKGRANETDESCKTQHPENGSTNDDPKHLQNPLSSKWRHQNGFDSKEPVSIAGVNEVHEERNENLVQGTKTGEPRTAATNDGSVSQSCKSLKRGLEDEGGSVGMTGRTAEEGETDACGEGQTTTNEEKAVKYSEHVKQLNSSRGDNKSNPKTVGDTDEKKFEEDDSDSSIEVMIVDPHLIDPVDKMKEFSKYSKCWVHVKYYDLKHHPDKKDFVRCNLCKRDITVRGGGGSNIFAHLYRDHPQEYMMLYPEAATYVGYESPSKSLKNIRDGSAACSNSQSGNLLNGQSNNAASGSFFVANIVNAQPFAGVGLSNYTMGGFYNYQLAANVAAQNRLQMLTGVGYGPYHHGIGWGVTQATNAQTAEDQGATAGISNSGVAQPRSRGRALPKNRPGQSHNTRSRFQSSARHHKKSQCKDNSHPLAQNKIISGVQTRSQRRAQSQALEQTGNAESQSSTTPSINRDKHEEDYWMELWDNTRLQLNELAKEYKSEKDAYFKKEIERDMAKLRKRKARFEQFLRLEPY